MLITENVNLLGKKKKKQRKKIAHDLIYHWLRILSSWAGEVKYQGVLVLSL